MNLRIASFLFVSFGGLGFFATQIQSRGDTGPNHQVRNMHFGVSGGNVNNIGKAFCCSGTLGSLLTDGTNRYILSNNHILALQDKAVAGQAISQPGLIDNGCRAATTVANFTTAPPLGSNVDAAIAQLIPGTMDSTGFIEDIGVINRTIVDPTVGLAVAKSGRTTGFTTGTIASTNTSVKIQYQVNCNQGKKYTIVYTNQVIINSSTFSAGGDSGSLIVTNNGSFNPVALLYAGSSSTTIANPIREVITKVGAALGRTVSFVGNGTGPNNLSEEKDASATALNGQMDQAVAKARSVLEQNRNNLMSRHGVLGVGLGLSDDGSEPAIVILLDQAKAARARLPDRIDEVPSKVVLTDRIIAY